MLKRSIFVLLVSTLSLQIRATEQYQEVEYVAEESCNEQDYQRIKEAVFAKVGPEFARSFNEKYPHWCYSLF